MSSKCLSLWAELFLNKIVTSKPYYIFVDIIFCKYFVISNFLRIRHVFCL
uniref:Uncharacterized protein n=1 Tax=Arundo donax TaxID=35708 RepID=A0A0A8YBZ0_ARUDO